jgi:hypothetical protein
MKVTRDTPGMLVLDEVPWLLAAVLALPVLGFAGATLALLVAGEWFGAAGALAGTALWVMALVVFVERLQLILDRGTDTVTLRRRTLWRYRQDRFALSSLSRVDVESRRGSKGGRVHRAVLVFDEGEDRGRHPVTEVFSSGSGAERTAAAVNGWLGTGPAP